MRTLLLVALLALAAAGCSSRELAELVLVGNHFTEVRDIPFAGPDGPRLDVYSPEGLDAPAPVAIFFYGGRWQSGSKATYRLLADALTRRGIVTVVPDYTLYPEATFPRWVEEGAKAVAWARTNAAAHGGDPDRIFLVGHSAGAHTAVLLTVDERYLRDEGVDPEAIRGTVSISGPVATRWTDADVQALMGPQSGWPKSYPESYIDEREGPFLFLHGGGDETLRPRNSMTLARLVRQRGGCARGIVYPGVGHIEIIVALMAPWLRRAPVRDDLVEFITDPRTCSLGEIPIGDP